MINRTCLACGKEYEYCGSCPTTNSLPIWKNIFDTENCKIVFENVSDYAQGTITKAVAKKRLSKCDLTLRYKKDIYNYIKDIMREEKTRKVLTKV